jgi:hypothetical protein
MFRFRQVFPVRVSSGAGAQEREGSHVPGGNNAGVGVGTDDDVHDRPTHNEAKVAAPVDMHAFQLSVAKTIINTEGVVELLEGLLKAAPAEVSPAAVEVVLEANKSMDALAQRLKAAADTVASH